MKNFFSAAKRWLGASCVVALATVASTFGNGFGADFFNADFFNADVDLVAATPTWALRNASNPIWSTFANVSDASSTVVSTSFDADRPIEFRSDFRPDFDANFNDEFDWESSIFRGQSATAPPVVSPTTSSTIGASTIIDSSTQIETPPVVGEEQPFEPVVATTNENSTTFQKMFKNKQSISGSYLYMPKAKEEGLGINEIEARALFAFPCQTLRDHSCLNNGYFLLTPSFTYDNWNLSNDLLGTRYEMPKSTFDAGLLTTFSGRLNDFEIQVETQIGVASSFQKINCKGIYVRGRAMGALPVDAEKKVKITGGVIYYDRIKYKLMPSGGFIWTPNAQNVLNVVFPDPQWWHYLTKLNETDWWFYLRGDIGGGRYLISSTDYSTGSVDAMVVDYDDYRVGLGLSFDCSTRLKGCFEVGGAFKRQLVAKTGTWYSPKDSVYLKFGLFF